jgi:hypothetical protein
MPLSTSWRIASDRLSLFENIALESTRTIDIDEFVPRSEIDDLYLVRPYYLVPDGKVGHDDPRDDPLTRQQWYVRVRGSGWGANRRFGPSRTWAT